MRTPLKAALAALMLASLFLSGAAAPQGGLRVLVMETVVSPGLPADLSQAVSDYLLKSLASDARYVLLDRRNLDAVLKEQAFQLSGLVDDGEAGRAGRLAGAQAVVVPRLAKLGDTWFLSARMIDVETGEVRAQCAFERSCPESAVPALGTDAGTALLSGQSPLAAARPAPAAGPVSMRLAVMDNEAPARVVVEDAVGRFRAQHPEVTLQVSYANALDSATRSELLAGRGPDLVMCVSNQIPTLAAGKALLPLDGIESLPGYDPRAAAVSRFAGRPYGVSVSVGDNLFLLYRRDLIQAPPESMEGILALAKELRAKGIEPVVWDTGDTYVFSAWLAAFGTDFLDGKGRFALKSYAVKQALREYKKDMDAFGIAGCGYQRAHDDFASGKAAMYVTGDWSLAEFYAPASPLHDLIGVKPLPALGKGRLSGYLGGRSIVASAALGLDKERLAREFMSVFLSPEIQRDVLYFLNRMPSSSDPAIRRSVALDPVYGGLDASIAASRPWPPINVREMADGFWGMNWWLEEFSAGRKSFSETADWLYAIPEDKLR